MPAGYSVGYAPTGRSVCKLCKNKIEKHELRIGIGSANFFNDGEGLAFKFRHIPCISKPMLRNLKEVSQLDGFEKLGDDHRTIVTDCLKGLWVGKKQRTGKPRGFFDPDVPNANQVEVDQQQAPKRKGTRRARQGGGGGGGKMEKKKKEPCPFGDNCFNENVEHKQLYFHGEGDDEYYMVFVPGDDDDNDENNNGDDDDDEGGGGEPQRKKKENCPHGDNCFDDSAHKRRYFHGEPNEDEYYMTGGGAGGKKGGKGKGKGTKGKGTTKAETDALQRLVGKKRKKCPYGDDCLSLDVQIHVAEFYHDGDREALEEEKDNNNDENEKKNQNQNQNNKNNNKINDDSDTESWMSEELEELETHQNQHQQQQQPQQPKQNQKNKNNNDDGTGKCKFGEMCFDSDCKLRH